MRRRTPLSTRLERGSKIDPETGCHLWVRHIDASGYSRIQVDGAATRAHIIAWTLANGPVPPGLELDHLCRRRSCINPAHLEAVTHRENMLRSESFSGINAAKTHCENGHPFDPANTYRLGARRQCRTCNAAAQRAYKRRKRAA